MSDLFFVLKGPLLIREHGLYLSQGVVLTLEEEYPHMRVLQLGKKCPMLFMDRTPESVRGYFWGPYTQRQYEDGLYLIREDSEDTLIATCADWQIGHIMNPDDCTHPNELQSALAGHCLMTKIEGRWRAREITLPRVK